MKDTLCTFHVLCQFPGKARSTNCVRVLYPFPRKLSRCYVNAQGKLAPPIVCYELQLQEWQFTTGPTLIHSHNITLCLRKRFLILSGEKISFHTYMSYIYWASHVRPNKEVIWYQILKTCILSRFWVIGRIILQGKKHIENYSLINNQEA